MANRSDITPELCRQLLRYEPVTGKLFWLGRSDSMFPTHRAACSWNGRYAGTEAFTAVSIGYRTGRLLDTKFQAHRVIWAIVHGSWPAGDVDHIDGDTGNNRLTNLRDVPHAVNNRNNRRPSNNGSGRIGVSFDSRCRKWHAYIATSDGRKTLGLFEAKADAIAARGAAEIEYGYHPNHGR